MNYALKNEEGMFRVVCKAQPCADLDKYNQNIKQGAHDVFIFNNGYEFFSFGKPKFQVGETIFVKEAYDIWNDKILFKADATKQLRYLECKWKSPIHMKQEHSRLTLKIKSVKVERLQDISEEDSAKESAVFRSDNYWHSTLHPIKGTYQCWISAKEAFSKLWNSTHKKPEEKWEANPWVFVYECGE